MRMSNHRWAALPTVLALLAAPAVFALEQPRYTVLEEDAGYQLRAYEPFLVAETRIRGDLDKASSEGFRRLADYIFGGNRAATSTTTEEARSERIAMTSPVSMQAAENGWVMSFMMPGRYRLDSLPTPVDPRIELRELPGRTMATLAYSGAWSAQRYEEHRSALLAWMEARDLRPEGPAIFARYDPPFTPWFMRRNEVLVPVSRPRGAAGGGG